MHDLLVAIDVGGSASKIVHQSINMSASNCWQMPPDIEPISQHQLDRLMNQQAGLGHPRAEHQAWLMIDEQVWTVGRMAQHFTPENRLHEKKYENALYKVLAIIGVILTNDELSTDKTVSLCLAIVLPMDEFSDRKRLQEQLQVMLKSFSFRGKRYRVKLDKFICRPEGAGLMAFYLQQFPEEFEQNAVGFLMLGHRNVTGLCFDAGELKASDSPLLGFSEVLQQVMGTTSGIQPEPLCEAMFLTLQQAATTIYSPNVTRHPKWANYPAIKALVTVKQSALRQAELLELEQAIDAAIQDYWGRLDRWLEKLFPQNLDAVVIGGGAAPLLQPELELFFNYAPIRDLKYADYGAFERRHSYDRNQPSIPILWWAPLPKEAHDKEQQDPILGQFWQDGRSIDVRGLFTLLQEDN